MIKISDLLNKDVIKANLEAGDKKGVLKELVDLLYESGKVKDKDKVLKVLLEREALGSTGIGEGVAIPHGKLDNLDKIVAAFGRSLEGVDFGSLDNQPAHLFFLFLAPKDSAGDHLKVLAKISRLLKNTLFREALLTAKDTDEIMNKIREEESR
ncbi:MAG: PTS sugar transporter subunit IIA [bacterium]